MDSSPNSTWKRKVEQKYNKGIAYPRYNVNWLRIYDTLNRLGWSGLVGVITSADEFRFILDNYDKLKQWDVQKVFEKACTRGYVNVVLQLFPVINPANNSNISIITACKYGHYEIAALLLNDSRVDPASQNNNAIIAACIGNHADTAELLLKDNRVDPSVNDNVIIKEIYSIVLGTIGFIYRKLHPRGEFSLANIILKYGDVMNMIPPEEVNNFINYFRIMAMLLKDPRVRDTLDPQLMSKYSAYLGG